MHIIHTPCQPLIELTLIGIVQIYMSLEVARFLRPSMHQAVRTRANPVYSRFFSAYWRQNAKEKPASKPTTYSHNADYEKRLVQLQAYTTRDDCYPRLSEVGHASSTPVRSLKIQSAALDVGTTDATCKTTISGRVTSVRTAGSKLVFIDLENDGGNVQVVCNFGVLQEAGLSQERFRSFKHVIRKGDWYSFSGNPHKTSTGEPSLLAEDLHLMSPSLHQLPTQLDDAETKARRPHVDMLVNRQVVQTLKMRSQIERHLARFFDDAGFSRVTTPLLTAGAGGAVARPFETVATELEGITLNLRIAPELWLKRLLVGGMGKVYELGPAFRNEGVDATHNPEFTMCESYTPFADLEYLMAMTEDLLQVLHEEIRKLGHESFPDLTDSIVNFGQDGSGFLAGPFPRLPFIPSIEKAMGRKMPDLSHSNATHDVLSLFAELSIPLPSKPTLPGLLDALCGHYLEPLCDKPTFITEHPAVMSPLAKSFTCPESGQRLSARAELFIRGHEYANMYEEENSPFEQRKKFVDQLAYRAIDGEGDGRAEVDESYLEALEWGLPPTGGWGMGVDRLVMLFTGQKRIGDVLPFGTLRNVVGLAQRQK